MKDFKKYRVPAEMFWSSDDQQQYRQSLVDDVNNKPLTAKERDVALKEVDSLVKTKRAEMNKPAIEKQKELEKEFWKDAAKDLGYRRFLTAEGVSQLERRAWDLGHANGFSEVYWHLLDLTVFAEKLKGCFK